MKERIKKILTNIESVKEDLLALSDDIWLSIDHNDSQALQRGAVFKTAYNECMAAFTYDADALSELIQNFTNVAVDPDEDTVQSSDTRTTNQDRERLIRELDPRTPPFSEGRFSLQAPTWIHTGRRALRAEKYMVAGLHFGMQAPCEEIPKYVSKVT